MQVGLYGVVNKYDRDRIDGAAKPSEMGLQPVQCFLAVLRRKPVLLVWKIDQPGWQDANDAGQAETNQRAQNAHAHKNGEERLLGLPAVRIAAAVEMRCHHVG